MTTRNFLYHAFQGRCQDYRYFPDPDLVPVVISDEWIAEGEGTPAGASHRNWNVIKKNLIFRIMMHRSSQIPNIWRICLRRQLQSAKAEKSINIVPYFVLSQFYPIFAYREAYAPLYAHIGAGH